MNIKKFNKVIDRVKKDKFVTARECYEIIKFLGGMIQNGSGSLKKIILNEKIVVVHWHNTNDFVRRDTWKALGLR